MRNRRAHDVLAQMAWERLPEGVGLEIHLIREEFEGMKKQPVVGP